MFNYFSLLKLWARAYRDREFHSAVKTNNGTESLNKVLKYSYLPRKKKMMLSSIITLLVEVFLPESHQKYLFLNYKQSGEYRCYRAIVPSYLHGRPKQTISHCLERRQKSLKHTSEDVDIIDDTIGSFVVKGTGDKSHKIQFDTPSCTCRDWITWHLPCKHFFFAIFRLHENWGWDTLPEAYKSSAYLSTDSTAINDYFQGTNSTEVQEECSTLYIYNYIIIYIYIPMSMSTLYITKISPQIILNTDFLQT